MEYLTKQQIFDKVLTHLREQQYQSVGIFTDPHKNKTKGCMYWNKETGRKCAVGCLIDENLYDPQIEGVTVNYWAMGAVETPRLNSLIRILCGSGIDMADNHIAYLLIELQSIHDKKDESSTWLDRLPTSFEYQMKCLAAYMELEYHAPPSTLNEETTGEIES